MLKMMVDQHMDLRRTMELGMVCVHCLVHLEQLVFLCVVSVYPSKLNVKDCHLMYQGRTDMVMVLGLRFTTKQGDY